MQLSNSNDVVTISVFDLDTSQVLKRREGWGIQIETTCEKTKRKVSLIKGGGPILGVKVYASQFLMKNR